jgi:hypothetical protein
MNESLGMNPAQSGYQDPWLNKSPFQTHARSSALSYPSSMIGRFSIGVFNPWRNRRMWPALKSSLWTTVAANLSLILFAAGTVIAL